MCIFAGASAFAFHGKGQIAALFLATGTAHAQMYGTPGIGRSHGYSGPTVSDFRLTPQDVACYRANYASTLAAQRCADQVAARYMGAGRKRGKR
jgi:hypothetical protein